MTFILRDRPDGQVEIIVNKPVLVGVFPERDTAERVCAFLQEDESFGRVDDCPSGFATAAADVAEVEDMVAALADLPPRAKPPAKRPRQATDMVQLPAIAEKLRPPAMIVPTVPHTMTEAQLDAAFARIAGGEKITAVAVDFEVSMYQLRGLWARHCRKMQEHIAEGGKIKCSGCKKDFIPSLTHPDTCARCSHE